MSDWEIVSHLTDYVISGLRKAGKTAAEADRLIGDLMESLGQSTHTLDQGDHDGR